MKRKVRKIETMCKLSVFKNGRIVTMDQKGLEVDCIAIEDGKVKALGSFNELRGLVEKGVEVHDLQGMTVMPGFTDCHVHLIMTGLRAQQLELREATSFDEIVDKIRCWNKANPGNEWVVGWGVDDNILHEKRMPCARDLDKAEIDRPVWVLRMDGNSSAVNSKGLEKVHFSKDDFSVLKDNDGKPTGIFKVPANFAVRLEVLNSLDKKTKQMAVQWAADFASSKGITSVHPMEYLVDIPFLDEISDDLPVRLQIYARSDDLEKILKNNYRTIGGDVLLDGTFGCHTAAISMPYADNLSEHGQLYYENRETFLVGLLERARIKHLQSAFHSIGDRAIEMHISILERVFGERPEAPIKHRIEHFVLPNDDQIERTARLGVMVSVAPLSIRNCCKGGIYRQRLGPKIVKKVLPLRKMFEHGIIVGGNSDSPVYEMNPLIGIHEAVNSINEAQRVNIKDALTMYTLNGAKLSLREDHLGSLEVGKLADMTVLKQDPLKASPREIKNIEVMMTLIGGKIKYKR